MKIIEENKNINNYKIVKRYIDKHYIPLKTTPKIFTIDDISYKFGVSLTKSTLSSLRLERIANNYDLDTQVLYYNNKIVGILVLFKNYYKNADNYSKPRYKLFNIFRYLTLEENVNDICTQVVSNMPLHSYYHYKLDYARFLYILFISDIPNDEKLLSVDHIDNNPLNNDLNNLQLLSNYYNYVKTTILRYDLTNDDLYLLAKDVVSVTNENIDKISLMLKQDYSKR